MKRYEFVIDGGKEELAKAISFCVAKAMLGNQEVSCNDFIDIVQSIEPCYTEWLEDEVDT